MINADFAGVSLKEKIAQMLIIGFKGTEIHENDEIARIILDKAIGGVVLFDYDFATQTYDYNVKNPRQLKKLTQALQAYAYRAGSPLLVVGIDYEGGKVNRLKESNGFPKTISAQEAASLSKEAQKEYANQMARTLQEVGINLNFAPVVDLNIDPEGSAIGKLGRSFSSDPEKVSKTADVFTKAFQDKGILCSYKHFPGHGSAAEDTHEGLVNITHTWKEEELIPYKNLSANACGYPVIMAAHVVHYGLDGDGYPATLSMSILKNLLREKLGFKGVIITDDMQMSAITKYYGLREALRRAINASADLLLFGNHLKKMQNPQEVITLIAEDVRNEIIPMDRIDEAYQRIIIMKKSLQI